MGEARFSSPYNKSKPCMGGAYCKHDKCECGHCGSYHMFGWECVQLDRTTLQTCGCKRYSNANATPKSKLAKKEQP